MPMLSRRARIVVAFLALYVLWGSTYLAIKYAIIDIPPLLMAGSRFLVAGGALYVLQRWRGAERPLGGQWLASAITGTLMLGGGNYAVVWSETRVASGVVALIVAAVPIWMVILDAMRPEGRKPSWLTVAGIAVGLFGVSLLVDFTGSMGGASSGGAHVDPIALVVLLLGTLCWAVGSIYSKGSSQPADALLGAAMQMLTGGALLTGLAFLTGQASGFSPQAITPRSAWGWIYLVVFGSIVGYTAYIWLLKVVSAARVATYSYVNPLIAVLLGWALGGEPLTSRIAVATVIILGSVALISVRGTPRASTGTASPPARRAA